jgi:hypothetical protein
VVFLTLLAARSCLAAGMSAADTIFHTGGAASARFDAMLKPPQIDRLSYEIDWSDLDGPSKISAILIVAWVYLFVGLLAAYTVSYYYCAFTWIYLLLRRSADGTDFDEMLIDAPPPGGDVTGNKPKALKKAEVAGVPGDSTSRDSAPPAASGQSE